MPESRLRSHAAHQDTPWRSAERKDGAPEEGSAVRGMHEDELRELARIADEIDLREGTVLTREGRPGREFFVLVDGNARGNEGRQEGRGPRGGDWFGEIALLTEARAPRPSPRPRPSTCSSSPTAASGASSRRCRRSRSRCSPAWATGSPATPTADANAPNDRRAASGDRGFAEERFHLGEEVRLRLDAVVRAERERPLARARSRARRRPAPRRGSP